MWIIWIVYRYNVDRCKRKLTRFPVEVRTPRAAVGALFGAGVVYLVGTWQQPVLKAYQVGILH